MPPGADYIALSLARLLSYLQSVALTALDILVILLVGAGLVFGFLRGFVCELLSLFAWILAVVALRYFHGPMVEILRGPVGSGAWLLALVIVFGGVFALGKLASRRVGSRIRQSVVGPIDRILGGGFGAIKGLIGATLIYLALIFIYDTMWGRFSPRPEWIAQSQTWPLLHASGEAIVDLVEVRRNAPPPQEPAENRTSPTP